MFGINEQVPKGWNRGFKLSYSRKDTDFRKRLYHHNDELKMNKVFREGDKIPEGWEPGLKREYSQNSRVE